ncbi:ABC transporter substrate-binding protein [Paenibacillus thalictri]|uniref:ABC transporter substrate-binding protein n=1 Tax=Paenibacillus thalictri TaxID=2527873 RepID=A0A4Q9DJT8_9BACL|nr:ABC transporter substrate-binding protein [Paenibacillus thalictri]TBL73301.1 ABC transporter substrate-binding protein [Paenibacillus thalictri]
MKMKKWSFIISLCVLVSMLAACSSGDNTPAAGSGDAGAGKAAATGGEMRVAMSAQPPTLDPHMTTVTATRDTARTIYETLVTLNSKYQVTPMLAEKIDASADGKTYTFQLRKGVKFHNGKEMTADDVVASMNRWKEKSSRAQKILNGATFEAKDPGTVVLQLKAPSLEVLFTLATPTQFPAIMPKEVVEGADTKGVKEYIGTGPFKFVEWKQDQYIHVAKFADYQPLAAASDGLSGKKQALVDDLYFDIVTDGSTRLAGIQTGQYDIVLSLPTDNYEQLKSNSSVVSQVALSNTFNAVFNKKQGLFAKTELRQAVNAALDIDKIMVASFSEKEFYRESSSYLFNEQADWYSEAGKDKYNQKNADKAKSLLAAGGYNGEEVRILTTRDYDFYYNASVVMKEQLEKVGMKVKLDIYDWPTLTSRREDPSKWDILIAGLTPVTTPSQLLYMTPTWAGWTTDEKIASTLKSIDASATKEDAKKLWDGLQAYAWETLPIIKMGDYYALNATTKQVAGFGSFEGPVLWNTSVAKK